MVAEWKRSWEMKRTVQVCGRRDLATMMVSRPSYPMCTVKPFGRLVSAVPGKYQPLNA